MTDKPEQVDILDHLGNPTGQVLMKAEAHQRSLHHAGAHLWIYNENGEVLLQKRADHKEISPGAWDISAAGHVMSGETPLPAMVRETYEELGLHVMPEAMEFIGVSTGNYQVGEWYHRPFNWTYLLKRDIDLKDITFHDDEVSQVAWIPLERLAKEVADDTIRSTRYGKHDRYVYDMAITEIRWRLTHEESEL